MCLSRPLTINSLFYIDWNSKPHLDIDHRIPTAFRKMPTTTRSSNPGTPEKQSPAQKRKAASTSPQSQRGRKQQKTLEETTLVDDDLKAAAESAEQKHEPNTDSKDDETKETNGKSKNSSTDQEQPDKSNPAAHEEEEEEGAIVRSPTRAAVIPSTVLEKGIFYFLARGRVGIDNPQAISEIARSYLVLRPLPMDAKLTDAPLEDLQNNRLLALPKKVLPKSHRDAFMSFVETAGVTVQDLKENFMKGSEYETKITGTRHTPPVTPLVEGVYAITTTGRTSHFAYEVTLPEKELGQVQKDVGFTSKGSFVVSAKNPEFPGPANAQLDKRPEWPEDLQNEFRGLRWMGLQARHLDYANAQFLLIGEGRDELRKAGEGEEGDQEKAEQKETAADELELLEDEDSHRTGQLRGDDTVFEDLGIAGEGYPALKSTW